MTFDAVESQPAGSVSDDRGHRVELRPWAEAASQLERPWRELCSAAGGPIEGIDWAMACATTSEDHEAIDVVAARRDGSLAAVVPLASKRARGVRRRVMLGVDRHHEPMDLLAADAGAVTDLAGALAALREPIEFGRLPADSPAVRALRASFDRNWLVVIRRLEATPYVPLDASWEEPERHLSAGRRSDYRRARRRAERLGRVSAEILVPRPDTLAGLLDEAFAVEARSWKGEAGTAILSDPAEERFIRRYVSLASTRGALRLCFLRIDGRAVAMQIAMVENDEFCLLKIGYDAEFGHCSPGVLLLRESLAHAAAAGLRTYRFLGRSEGWIASRTSHESETVAVHAYPLDRRGAAALAADVSMLSARRVSRRVRALTPRLRRLALSGATPLLTRVAGRYIAGDRLTDAAATARTLTDRGLLVTLGYWNATSDDARAVAQEYLRGLDVLAGMEDSYLSAKLPALGFSPTLLAEVLEDGARRGIRVHLDSHWPATAARTRAMLDEALGARPEADVGVTIPGRWNRSAEDARWACARGLSVRVVKGEWPDPGDPDRDLRAGYLEVIDALAGAARHVGVATHDPWLAGEAVRRLRDASTPCTLELLYGLPMRESLRQARALDLPVRVYVPYGTAYMPYAVDELRRHPRMALWLARDLWSSTLDRDPLSR